MLHAERCSEFGQQSTSFGRMMEKAPGKPYSLTKSHLPCSARWVLASTRRASCQQRQKGVETLLPARGSKEQLVSLQGHCVLWKISFSSFFPLIPCLEESQLHREGTGMGTTITDAYAQRVDSERQCSSSAPWHSLLRTL